MALSRLSSWLRGSGSPGCWPSLGLRAASPLWTKEGFWGLKGQGFGLDRHRLRAGASLRGWLWLFGCSCSFWGLVCGAKGGFAAARPGWPWPSDPALAGRRGGGARQVASGVGRRKPMRAARDRAQRPTCGHSEAQPDPPEALKSRRHRKHPAGPAAGVSPPRRAPGPP